MADDDHDEYDLPAGWTDPYGEDAGPADDCLDCGMCEQCVERSIAAAGEGDDDAAGLWRDTGGEG